MKVICLSIVLAVALIGIAVMKKIQPENKWFPLYALGIVMLAAWAFTKTNA